MDCLWNEYDTVAVAVSGGVDSMVLLDKVNILNHHKKLYALHVNHQLRDVSDEEEKMIQAYCKQHNIELITYTIPKNSFNPNKSIQREARDIRYHFFETQINIKHIDCLLTAHHKDDQLETIFFRLMTNRYNYQPINIQQVVARDGYQLIRPLINVSKAELIEYAHEFKVPYMTDASNTDSKYLRNFIRNDVFKVLDDSSIDKHQLLNLADYMEDVDDLIDLHVERYKMDIENNALSRYKLSEENRLVIQKVLLSFIQRYVTQYTVSFGFLNEVIRVLQSDATHASFAIAPGWHIQIAYDKLIVRNKNEKIDDKLEVVSPGKYYFNDYKIEIKDEIQPITIRTRKDGDVIEIKGMHQKVARILKDLKVPVYDRPKIPIVCVEDEVIAIGHYKSNHHPFNNKIIITKEN